MASQVMRITLKAYDHELVDASAKKIIETVKKNGSQVSGPVPLPTKREVVTILRATHMILSAAVQSLSSSWTILHWARTFRKRSHRSFPVWQRAAYSPAVHWSAAKLPRCRASIRKMNTMLPVLPLVS